MQIPNSVEDAVLNLKGLGELMVASEWQRAALVWAFTEDKQGKRTSSRSEQSMSLTEFAKLEISGLGSRTTLVKYRKAWAKAIEDGIATDVKPGDLIDLPDAEWQPYFNPPRPKKDRTPAVRSKLPEWDENSWDDEKINNNPRLVKMSEIMFDTLDGVEDDSLHRVAQSIIDFAADENKARGMARMMHSLIEFTSAYKASNRA